MSTRGIVLRIKIWALKDFLSVITTGAIKEIGEIEKKIEVAGLEETEHLEDQKDPAFMRVDIASRAIYQEVTNLVESEIQKIALPLLKSNKPRKWPPLPGDLKFSEAIILVERKYGFKFADLDAYDTLWKVRTMTNSMKHRGGLVDFREPGDSVGFPVFILGDSEKASELLEKVEKFIYALWKKTGPD